MAKGRRNYRSSSRERSRSPKISKKGLQDQINLMAKSIAELVEAQKLAIKATTTSTETQKATVDVCDKNNPELPPTTDAPVLLAESNDNKSMDIEICPLEDGENEGECPDLDLDEELLEVLGEEVPVAISQVKINEKLKSWWKTWMEKGLPEETRKELLKKYPRDGEFITEAPKINLEVQRHLSEIAKKRDGHFLVTQNCVGTAISSLSGAVSMLTEASKEPIDQTLLLKHLWDTGKILADVFNQQSVARKSFITPTLDKDIKPTLDASISDEWLYGQKLTEQVKEAKAIVKAATTLKTQDRPVAKKPFNRFFNQGNVRGPPLRHRQVGSYNPRRFTNANYRYRAPTASARMTHKTSSTERTQTSRKK